MFFVVTGHHSFKSLLRSRFFSITTVLSRRVVETSIVLLICVREFVHFAIHFFISFKICTLISIRVRYTALWLAIAILAPFTTAEITYAGPSITFFFLSDCGCLYKMNEKCDHGILLVYPMSGESPLLFHCFFCNLECIYNVFSPTLR